MALALIHHLAISNNLPFEMISGWLAECCTYLIIEFVPKQDSQVQTLLKTREDIFTDYSESGFEASFERDFQITKSSLWKKATGFYIYFGCVNNLEKKIKIDFQNSLIGFS